MSGGGSCGEDALRALVCGGEGGGEGEGPKLYSPRMPSRALSVLYRYSVL